MQASGPHRSSTGRARGRRARGWRAAGRRQRRLRPVQPRHWGGPDRLRGIRRLRGPRIHRGARPRPDPGALPLAPPDSRPRGQSVRPGHVGGDDRAGALGRGALQRAGRRDRRGGPRPPARAIPRSRRPESLHHPHRRQRRGVSRAGRGNAVSASYGGRHPGQRRGSGRVALRRRPRRPHGHRRGLPVAGGRRAPETAGAAHARPQGLPGPRGSVGPRGGPRISGNDPSGRLADLRLDHSSTARRVTHRRGERLSALPHCRHHRG